MKNGFYLRLGNKDLFIITDRKRKDKTTLNMILEKLKYAPCEALRRELDYWLAKGTYEERETENGHTIATIKYYNNTSTICGNTEDFTLITL